MPAIININLFLAAYEYRPTSVSAERRTNPQSEMTHAV